MHSASKRTQAQREALYSTRDSSSTAATFLPSHPNPFPSAPLLSSPPTSGLFLPSPSRTFHSSDPTRSARVSIRSALPAAVCYSLRRLRCWVAIDRFPRDLRRGCLIRGGEDVNACKEEADEGFQTTDAGSSCGHKWGPSGQQYNAVECCNFWTR